RRGSATAAAGRPASRGKGRCASRPRTPRPRAARGGPAGASTAPARPAGRTALATRRTRGGGRRRGRGTPTPTTEHPPPPPPPPQRPARRGAGVRVAKPGRQRRRPERLAADGVTLSPVEHLDVRPRGADEPARGVVDFEPPVVPVCRDPDRVGVLTGDRHAVH